HRYFSYSEGMKILSHQSQNCGMWVKRWLLINISQEGATIAQNIPMIKIIINSSIMVKPGAGVVALPLSVLFIDT
ncbi:hypothetical protein QUB08_25835, partial [Microcoleus sp. BR0-C5]|uniref:hypothetical protein n=1 Tax=Microcoleus sp. BR0-C5 TaxID=2818713 RepID=UPI002FD60232